VPAKTNASAAVVVIGRLNFIVSFLLPSGIASKS
jgi:hypothetical protein